MGRQTRKTKQAIFDAFAELLNQKKYSKITVQELAELADVGRSTIYSHFETKEDLLTAMCIDIFEEMLSAEHVISDSPENILVMLLTHIQENKKVIAGIFASEGMDVFVEYCKHYFFGVVETSLLEAYDEEASGIPKDFLENHLIGTFMEMLRWWAKNNMKQTPQELAHYFMKITNSVINSGASYLNNT